MIVRLFAARALGQGDRVLRALLRQAERVLGLGHLQSQATEVALACKAPILGGLDLSSPCLELRFRRLGELAGLRQASLESLRLRGGTSMSVPRLAPLLPHDASSKQLEPFCRLRRFPRRG